MRRYVLFVTALAIVILTALTALDAWGVRAHTWINRVAVQAISADGPVFLKAHEDWIGYLSTIPDTWRRPSEPFVKMLEDPNHGWFKEQFAFMKEIPRSRYEFVLKLYDEQRRLAAAGDPAAALTNVRWTGTMAYAAVEGYERMLSGMRRYRDARLRNEDTRFVEQEIAFYMGWAGHYTGDGAQPLHDTIHHDGWQGANPKGFTTNPQVHGLFETRFVDSMKLDGADLLPKVPPAKTLADPFTAILAHLDEAGRYTEKVYELEQRGALADGAHPEARALVIQQAARGAALLRDLAHTAWVNSGRSPDNDPGGNPITPAHPRYNPATGSAPAHGPAAGVFTKPVARRWYPHTLPDPVVGKNFFLFEVIKRNAAAAKAIAANPALTALRDARLARLAIAASSCNAEPQCHADAFRWSDADIQIASTLIREALTVDPAGAALAGELVASGFYQRYDTHEKPQLIAAAWQDAANAMNRIIDVYALGVPPLYKAIDSVSYDASSDLYRRVIDLITSVIQERRTELTMFYEPTLSFTRRLLDVNRRDEAARFEPLHLGENARAFRRVQDLNWADFKYTAILVPGAGPDRPDVSLDPWAKMRIELAVARFQNGDAPFIIVSGGNVHPSQTPFNEAFEMKKSLMRDFGIPPDAILIDPHARRHTTTNLRNAARLALRYGMPSDRPMLITSDASQSAYISGTVFRDRCLKELGYLPGVIGNRLSKFDLEFTPDVESLHADARDPLDP